MAGVIDKILDMVRLSPEDDYDDDDDLLDDDTYEKELEAQVSRMEKEERRKAKKEKASLSLDEKAEEQQREKPEKLFKMKNKSASSNVTPLRTGGKGMEVCLIRPVSVEDAREISDTLLSGRAVVINLEGLHVELAQRIIDFTSGACYSINGNLQKISNYIFIVTPQNIELSGDFQEFLTGSSGDLDISTLNLSL